MIAVREVEQGTLADRSGFRVGDHILAINGEQISDLIDFQVASSEAHLLVEVERQDRIYEVEVERRSGEAMGLDFEEMHLRRCNNKCVFCFLHQMPGGLRRSLYFEDDDYRLSFLHGSYVTLTNVRDSDLQRIIEQGLTPQYISVHATDPELRQQLLGRTKPTMPILERIQLLADGGIEMHAQVVLCPGWNDGPHLERTLSDLAPLYPAVRSVALVPVGLTRFRQHLAELRSVTREDAKAYLEVAETWGDRCVTELGARFVYAADELFLRQSRLPPQAEYYDAFPQIENGIGMVRSFLDRWRSGRSQITTPSTTVRMAMLTGTIAPFFLEPVVNEINEIANVEVELLSVANDFFGHGITVSGLLAGKDILAALAPARWNLALLPPNCINGDGLTLDDMTVADLSERSGVTIAVGDYDLALSIQRALHGDLVERGRGRQLSDLGFFVGRREGN
ncbi:MAG: DUF512 domain-containing protein [Candidatus Latescibacterota bacterium]|nr:DUF512 domain-containing protein [Candidatus Latescibacterota bacterium]